ncbi:MAG: hypothetical protein K0S16_781, partial [Moraxellaceae bacterium]|nr:hypothetical protein [Moraxellaceae bacterium]
MRADLAAAGHAVVDAHAGQFGRMPAQHAAGLRQEVVARVFRIEAHLDGGAVQLDVVLRQRQRLAVGDAQLPLDQVLAGDEFGDGMLDLQARIHFQEIEIAVGIEQEFHGAGADVVDALRGGNRSLAHAPAQVRRHHGTGRFFHDLLVAALDGAVALAEVDAVAVRVAEDLDLDVARRNHGLLQDEFAGAEGVLRLAARRRERGGKVGFGLHQAHA